MRCKVMLLLQMFGGEKGERKFNKKKVVFYKKCF